MKKFVFLLGLITSAQLFAQNVGIGTATPQQKLDVAGTAVIRDSLGIGVTTPGAPLQFSNGISNRKLVLFDDQNNNNHQFYGFGVNPSALRYQSAADHVFYSGQGASSSLELLRLKANGRVGIGNSNPSYTLDVAGTSRVVGDFIHTSADAGGTWVYLSNTSNLPTGWKMVTTPSPSAGNGGNLYFYNINNTSALTLQQNGNVGIGTNLTVGVKVTAPTLSADFLDADNVAAGSVSANNIQSNGNIAASGQFQMGLQQISETTTLAGGFQTELICNCPSGTKVIGGGGGHRDNNLAQSAISVNFSGPKTDGSGWRVLLNNSAPSSRTIQVWAICARVQ
ncbi:MAG TPA: hypothetical protein VM871_12155 [Flavisolibacter sp.]|nr:hypothetical protein [Flavisolibacter sp.]